MGFVYLVVVRWFKQKEGRNNLLYRCRSMQQLERWNKHLYELHHDKAGVRSYILLPDDNCFNILYSAELAGSCGVSIYFFPSQDQLPYLEEARREVRRKRDVVYDRWDVYEHRQADLLVSFKESVCE